MANFAKGTLLFAVTTDPDDRVTASPHSGGWSESHWGNVNPIVLPFLQQLAQRRANMLPAECSVIGWRNEIFTLTGNKLFPVGATSGRFQYPGMQTPNMNLPQDSLMVSAVTDAAPNATRFNLRGLPDYVIQKGEYQPSPNFKTQFTNYANELINSRWGFIGRVKTGASARVNSINVGVVTLNGAVGGVVNESYLILNRVYDSNGNPVTGKFLITLIAGNAYTVEGLAGVSVTIPSGTARIDSLAFYQYTEITPNRAVIRKIGRPFEQYRGRASARR